MAETEDQSNRNLWGVDVRGFLMAGVIAGLVFLIVEMLLIPLTGGSAWGPPRMMAAIVLGPEVLPPPATFVLGIFAVALVVHLVLSIVYAFVLGLVISGRSLAIGITVGLLFGLALYGVNFYLFTELFPWFAEARNAITVVAHLLFGGVAGGVYVQAEAGAPARREPEVQATSS